jgi:hypothetical protein
MPRKSLAVLLLLFACVALSSCAHRALAPQPAAVEKQARQFVDLLAKGDFATAVASFDPTMKQRLPADKLAGSWKDLIAKAGAFRKQDGVRTAKEQGYDVAYLACEFERATLDVKVVFDQQGQVTGLWMVPHS